MQLTRHRSHGNVWDRDRADSRSRLLVTFIDPRHRYYMLPQPARQDSAEDAHLGNHRHAPAPLRPPGACQAASRRPFQQDGQRVDPLHSQYGSGQEAHQGARAGSQGRQARADRRRHLNGTARGGIRYGLRPARLPPRAQHSTKEANQPGKDPRQPTITRLATSPGSTFGRHGGSNLNRRGHCIDRPQY